MKWIFALFVCLPVAYLNAQEIQSQRLIFGIISDSNGKPAEGITIRWQQQNYFATSNGNGRFQIAFDRLPDTLLISHVSYLPFKVAVNNENGDLQLTVKLRSNELEEVMVSTGYQKLKPNEMTGAVQVIDQRLLREQTGTNILNRINNVAPGVRFDTRPTETPGTQKLNINIRGLSTISGPLDPLIVVDGFIYEGDINNLDPNLIDNITILKDAAASSIWGARAGNGVIVISTHKGSARKPSVSVNANTIVGSQPDLHDVYQLPADEYIDIENYLFNNGHFNQQINFRPHAALSPAVEIFLRRRNGEISAEDSLSAINRLKNIDARDAYRSLGINNSIIQQYAMNISGGSEKHTYALGAGFTGNRTTSEATSRKINISVAQSYKPVDKLTIDLSVMYTNSLAHSGKPGYSSFTLGGRTVPYLEFSDAAGNQLPLELNYRNEYLNTLLPGQLLRWNYLPFEDYKHHITKSTTEELYTTASVQYQILPYLKFDGGYQYQRQRIHDNTLADSSSYFARNMINQFSYIDQNTGALKRSVPLGGIKTINETLLQTSAFRGQFIFDYSRGLHGFNVVAGAESRESKTSTHSFTSYGHIENPLSNLPVDYSGLFPTLPDYGFSNIPGAPVFGEMTNRFVSLYASGLYRFNKKYSISGSARRDGANVFAQTSNNRWKPLWSAGAAWDIHAEQFYRLGWLPRLKLRLTYGLSGNIDPRRTPLPVASATYSPLSNLFFNRIEAINNPSLRWEKTSTVNLGIDFAITDERISGSIDFYSKKGTDLYGVVNYDYTLWGSSPVIQKNLAGIKGHGIDLLLNTKNIEGKFAWNTALLFSLTKNTTAEYQTEYSAYIRQLIGNGSAITPVIGKPLYAIAAYRWGGLDNEGDPQGFLDGKLTKDYEAMSQSAISSPEPESIVFKGSAVPEIYGSLINRFAFKRFSLAVNISYKASYYFLRPSTSYSELFNRGAGFADLATRWKTAGDENITNMPSLRYPEVSGRDNFYNNSEIMVEKGDHVRLEYINLEYNFGSTRRSFVKSFSIYTNASNLGIIWKANDAGIDPAYVNMIRPPKAFTFGIRAGF